MSMDVNSNVSDSKRQSGELAGTTYNEAPSTKVGGSLDYLSQVNNGASANSALLGVRPGYGLSDSYLSPNIDFSDSKTAASHIEVTVTPLGLGSTATENVGHWAAVEFGAPQGTRPSDGGTGITITREGTWQLYDNGNLTADGAVDLAANYQIEIDLTPGSGAYIVSINGTQIYSGDHGSAYTTNYVSLESHSSSDAPGSQLDYFSNLLIMSKPFDDSTDAGSTSTDANIPVTGVLDVNEVAPMLTLAAVSAVQAPSINLLTDGFATPSNSMDINNLVATRQTGMFSGTTYLESATTRPTPAAVTQVNNGAVRNTLLLGNSSTQKRVTVSPDANLFDPRLGLNSVSVDVTPLSTGTTDLSFIDHWSGLALGGAAGSTVQQKGVSGVLIRAGGKYAVFENGDQVAFGSVTMAKTYSIQYTVDPTTAAYQLSINGSILYSGTHVGGFSARDRITLCNLTLGATKGLQLDYFDNLKVMGQGSPYATAPNTVFYISPTGSDTNDGTSALTPWKTLDRVNQEFVRSGDRFLFQGGSSFTGKLTITSDESGTADAPVVIGSYGTGKATIYSGADNAIELDRANYVTVSNLALVGAGYNVNPNSSGILATSGQSVATNGIKINGVDVSGYGDSGVKFNGDFNNISITNSTLHDNGNGGLWIANPRGPYSQNVYVGNVVASNNAGSLTTSSSGYGILLAQVQGGVVERSTTLNNGWLAGNIGQTGGIEAIHTDRILIQYNESGFNHRGEHDGDGIGIDSSTNSIMQYNYTHDNEGAGLFLGAETGTSSNNNVIRYNISQNDARLGTAYSGIHVWQDVNNSDIYNNTVYMSSSGSAAVAMNGFIGQNLNFRNNIIMSSGGSPLIYYRGGGSGVLFQGNEYWAANGPLHIYWVGNDYTSLSAFQLGSRQEMDGSTFTGFQTEPGLLAPGIAGTLGNAVRLPLLTGYVLSPTSPLLDGGLDLSQYSVSWDPNSYATDAFLSKYFSSTPKDFYGSPLPLSGLGELGVGVYRGSII